MFKIEQYESSVASQPTPCSHCQSNVHHLHSDPKVSPLTPPQYELDIKEAATYLGWKPQTMYNRIACGNAPERHKRWGRWFFYIEKLEEFKRRESKFFRI